MSEYDSVVERQRLLIEAEKWASGVRSLHAHQLNSMAYDDRPQDTEDGGVQDIEYNNGLIVRSKDGKVIHTFGEKLEGESLLQAYTRGRA